MLHFIVRCVTDRGLYASRSALFALPCVLLVLAPASDAACSWVDPPVAPTVLTASDGQPGEMFGEPIDADGSTIVVSASSHEHLLYRSGAVYVFELTGGSWEETAELLPDACEPDCGFGYDLAVSGEHVAVGAQFDESNYGSVHLFQRVGGVWQFEMKITSPDGASGDAFGASVGLDGDTLVVGAPYYDVSGGGGGGTDAGAVYVFTRTVGGWEFQDKVTAYSPTVFDHFGFSVAVSDGVLVAGNPGWAAIEAFVEIGGQWYDVWMAGDPPLTNFGAWTAISRDHTIVAYSGRELTGGTGAVRVFTPVGSSWAEVPQLYPQGPDPWETFGYPATVQGPILIAGKSGDDVGGVNSGAAYVYYRVGNAWSEMYQLKADTPIAEERFGASVGLAAGRWVIGAPHNNGTVGYGGSVSVYDTGLISWDDFEAGSTFAWSDVVP